MTGTPEPSPLRLPEPFEIEGADGGPLRGDLYLPRAPSAPAPGGRAVILCHGFRGYKDWGFIPLLASTLADRGLAAVAFNFSASGIADRAGTFSELERFRRGTYGGDLEDLRRVAGWTVERLGGRGPAEGSLGLAGHSRGGVIALLHASGDPRVRALATLGAPSRIGVWPEEYFPAWRRGESVPVYDFRTRVTLPLGPEILADLERNGARYDAARAGAALRAPFLVVHGSKDALVPLEEARSLAVSARGGPSELCVVRGAGHSFQAGDKIRRTPPPLLEAIEAVAAWMRRWL